MRFPLADSVWLQSPCDTRLEAVREVDEPHPDYTLASNTKSQNNGNLQDKDTGQSSPGPDKSRRLDGLDTMLRALRHKCRFNIIGLLQIGLSVGLAYVGLLNSSSAFRSRVVLSRRARKSGAKLLYGGLHIC